MHASTGRDHTRLVACTDYNGTVAPCEVVALRPMPPEAPGPTNDTLGNGTKATCESSVRKATVSRLAKRAARQERKHP
jgi:hypothetical protein